MNYLHSFTALLQLLYSFAWLWEFCNDPQPLKFFQRIIRLVAMGSSERPMAMGRRGKLRVDVLETTRYNIYIYWIIMVYIYMEFYGYTTIVYMIVYFSWSCAVCTLIAVIMSGILKIVNLQD